MVRERQKRERKRGDLNHLSVHQCLRSAIRDSQQPTSPIGFLFLKLPPPPCAVHSVNIHISDVYIYIILYFTSGRKTIIQTLILCLFRSNFLGWIPSGSNHPHADGPRSASTGIFSTIPSW